MIKINEIFYSIQGESTYVGMPFIFIRLTGCNLRCIYCDTKYAYYKGNDYKINEILRKLKNWDCKLVEITGGEPLIQREVFNLIDKLIESGYKVLVETNGTVDIGKVNNKAVIIMDIKCPSSGEEDKVLWTNIYKLKSDDEIKFVIADVEDYKWAKDVVYKFNLEDRKVLFSPVFKRMPSGELENWIREDNLKVKFQPQLHKIANFK